MNPDELFEVLLAKSVECCGQRRAKWLGSSRAHHHPRGRAYEKAEGAAGLSRSKAEGGRE